MGKMISKNSASKRKKEKSSSPDRYEMVLCPVCDGKGKIPKHPDELKVCPKCGGFGLINKENGGKR